MYKQRKDEGGITLIALVVTIVVLLILAGVSISMLTGENGIVTQAQKAKLDTRGGDVEEKVNMWKSEKYSTKYTDTEALTEEEMLQSLKDEKLVYEEEIDRENKIITIGTRKINYNIEEKIELQDDDLNTSLKTMILVYEVAEDEEVSLPVDSRYKESYDFEVDWGDGSEITTVNSSNIDIEQYHTYQTGGKKEVKINGIFKGFLYNSNLLEKRGIKEIKQWGATQLEVINIGSSWSATRGKSLENIAEPSKNSFKNLKEFSISDMPSIKELPENLFLGATNLKSVKISDMSAIEMIPKDFFKTNINLESVYFSRTEITEIPDKLFETNVNLNNVNFSNTYITNIPETLFETNVNLESVSFSDTLITEIPEGIFSNCVNLKDLYEAFARCENLTSISSKLFENCDKIECFTRTFYECTSLTGDSTELYKRGTNSAENEYQGNPDGEGCYYKCTQLEDYGQIPEYWKKEKKENLPR